MKRVEWKVAASEAGRAADLKRYRTVQSVWAAARQDYLKLVESENSAVADLRSAVRRYEELDRERCALAKRLRSAA